MRICRIATVPFFLCHHLGGQIASLVRAGNDVYMVSSPGPAAKVVVEITGAQFRAIHIARAISLFEDLTSLWRLYAFFRRGRFDLVHSTTPKAGLLTAVAARLAGVPIRLHTFTGQVWAERTGLVRWVAKVCDRLLTRLNTRCYADSPSQQDFLVAEGVAPRERIAVLGRGSLAGVDVTRFNCARRSTSAKVKARLCIPAEAPVVGFVGRITTDKGIGELVAAFQLLACFGSERAHLVLVGPQESERDPLPEHVVAMLVSDKRIRMVGYTAEPEEYMSTFDVLCLPSYREGFGNVVIEAAAMGIPTIGTRIVGLQDAIVDGVTGMLVPPKDYEALAVALAQLLNDTRLRREMGLAAEQRAIAEFDARRVNADLLAEYERLAQSSA